MIEKGHSRPEHRLMNASRTGMGMMQRSERRSELWMNESKMEDWCGWHSLSAASCSCKMDIIKRRMWVSMAMEEGNNARSAICP